MGNDLYLLTYQAKPEDPSVISYPEVRIFPREYDALRFVERLRDNSCGVRTTVMIERKSLLPSREIEDSFEYQSSGNEPDVILREDI